MTRRQWPMSVVVALFASGVALLAAQAPRDGVYREGTGSISGLVVAADGGAPIPRAAIALSGGAVAGFTAIADAKGRFDFDRLPAGQYTLRASKASFLSMAFGQSEPGRGSGLPIALKDGERLTGIQWALPGAASIAGRILDQAGRPMRGAVVALQQRRIVDGDPQLVTCCGTARTDPAGLFRLTGLAPGEYVVSSLPPADYNVIPDVLSSFGQETRLVSDDELRWALRELDPASRGESARPEPPRGRTVSYGRTYFPGTVDPSRAPMVTVKAGEDLRGVDFSMVLQQTAFIQGRAVGLDGQPVADARLTFSDGWSTVTLPLAADGTFVRRNLLPGRFSVGVRSASTATWGGRVVDVNGVDIPDMVLTLGPAPSITGRVVFEPGDVAPLNLASVGVQMLLRPTNGSLPVRVAADGTFRFAVVEPGRYRLTASVAAANRGPWSVKSIMSKGVDLLDAPIEVGAAEGLTDVVVTFTTKSTSLSGTLSGADGAPAPGYYVVVFPTDPALWTSASRRIPAPARASTDGRFSFQALPPGQYFLAAVTSADATDLADPAYLKTLTPVAITVALADGEQKTQDVKFARGR